MPRRDATPRVAGLDAIRFTCAYVVFMWHTPGVWLVLGPYGRRAVIAGKVIRDLYNGSAAVIVFFVISGFCIHFPHRDGQPIGLDYFVRRYVRIGIPLVAALCVSPYFGMPEEVLRTGVMWSVYCELIYYSVYPILLRFARKRGWFPLIAVTFIAAFARAFIRPIANGDYNSGAVLTMWILGMPCWLMGCALAESPLPQPLPVRKMFALRLGVWATAIVLGELHFHTRLHFDLTLNFFAVLVYYWLLREIAYYGQRAPWSWLERAGGWSYSLYLFHETANLLATRIFPNWSGLGQWVVRAPLTLVACYVFYLLFERPSHLLARRAAAAVSAKFSRA